MSTREVYAGYRFWVEIGGITEGGFSECSGLQIETEVFEWEEGGQNGFRHRLPGRAKYVNLVLKRGMATPELWSWCERTRQGQIERLTLGIVIYGYKGAADLRWDVIDALPVKWSGPTLKTGASEVAVESIELLHHGLKRV
jgi:phage tail-like protein